MLSGLVINERKRAERKIGSGWSFGKKEKKIYRFSYFQKLDVLCKGGNGVF
jgi:hypothetical protein